MTERIQAHTLPPKEKATLLDRLSRVLESRSEIIFAYAHGSFLEDGPFRDLDVAVYLEPTGLPPSRFHYEDRLAQEMLSQLTLTFPLDVRILNDSSIAFQYRVFRGCLLVDRDRDARLERLAYAVARYLDLKPILEHHTREAFGDDHRP
jgi:hypothetical protein